MTDDPDDPNLKRLRAIWDSLPETEETWPWGSLHVRVAGKIFGGYGSEGGIGRTSFKLDKEFAAELVKRDRFEPAKYVGKHGWVTFEFRGRIPWGEIEAMVVESYRRIAPKKILKRLGDPAAAAGGPAPRTRGKAVRKSSAKQSTAKKATARKVSAKKAPKKASKKTAKRASKKAPARESSTK